MAMCAVGGILLLIVGASVGIAEFVIAVGCVVFVFALSEPTSRSLSYAILHRDHIDISKKPWFAKSAAEKWTIRYEEIGAVEVKNETAEVTVLYRGKGAWRSRWRLRSNATKDRSVTFRLGDAAEARECQARIGEAIELASRIGLGGSDSRTAD